METLKVCITCYHAQPLAAFSKDNQKKDGHRGSCKTCSNAAVRAWRLVNVEAVRSNDRRRYAENPDRTRATRLRRSYGITAEAYETMLAQQNGVCLICHEPPGKKRLHVDHSHTTGVVRGLLCSNCNTALGKFKDDITRLQAAIDYLTETMCDRSSQ